MEQFSWFGLEPGVLVSMARGCPIRDRVARNNLTLNKKKSETLQPQRLRWQKNPRTADFVLLDFTQIQRFNFAIRAKIKGRSDALRGLFAD